MIVEVADSSMSGYLFVLVGGTRILSTLFLAVFFAGVQVFGPLNDALIGLAAVLGAVLAWQVVGSGSGGTVLQNWLPPLLATVGAAIVTLGSILVILQIKGYVLAAMYMGLGNAVMGLWVLGLLLISTSGDVVPSSLRAVGVVAGALMALGLICVIPVIYKSDDWEIIPRYVLITTGAGAAGWIGLYPVWCILVGLRLLRA